MSYNGFEPHRSVYRVCLYFSFSSIANLIPRTPPPSLPKLLGVSIPVFHHAPNPEVHHVQGSPVLMSAVSEIVVAKILSGFTHGLVKGLTVALVIFAITPFRFEPAHIMAYLAFLLPGSALFSCAGVISGTVMDKPETIGKVESVFIMPLIFMSGLFFPLSSYPVGIIPWIKALPTTALFEGVVPLESRGAHVAPPRAWHRPEPPVHADSTPGRATRAGAGR